MSRLSLAMIVRDVEDIVAEAIESVIDQVDDVVIVDTGSKDKTKEKIEDCVRQSQKELKILDYTYITHPNSFILDDDLHWKDYDIPPAPFSNDHMLLDFAGARNHGWFECRGEYVLWIDSDDTVEGAERIPEILKTMDEDKLGAALLGYDYMVDEDGKTNCRLTRERIVRRTGNLKWMEPVHEYLVPISRPRGFSSVVIRHQRHKRHATKQISYRNLKILSYHARKLEDEGKAMSPRTLFYLGMEKRGIRPEEAIEHFREYTRVSGWDEERATANIMAGELFEKKAVFDEAFAHYAQAAVDFSPSPDGWFGLARIAHNKRDWKKCVELTERGFEISEKNLGRPSVLHHDPLKRTYWPYVFYAGSLAQLRRFEEAIAACDKGLQILPSSELLLECKDQCLKERGNQGMSDKITFKTDEPLGTPPMPLPSDIVASFAIQMWKQITKEGDWKKALVFLDSLPMMVAKESQIKAARKMTVDREILAGPAPKNDKEAIAMSDAAIREVHREEQEQQSITHPSGLRIVIWTGEAWENWSPVSIDEGGIGGSETAAVCMARELCKRGHRVTVISQCFGKEGIYDGVEYVYFENAIYNAEKYACDVFISSRQPAALDEPFRARSRFLWVHDIHVGAPATLHHYNLFDHADRIFCLSAWHKQFFAHTYPKLDPNKIIETRNSIDLDRFKNPLKKLGNRLIYSSSPDRGLETLLKIFPTVRKHVPDAELHVFYGFYNWRMMAKAVNNEEAAKQADMFESYLTGKEEEGIFNHGRVGQRELAEHFLRAKIWSYPTWFSETSCVSAMEAQAAGCVPVTTDVAALSETVHHGFLFKPPSDTVDYARAWARRVVHLLLNEKERENVAEAGRKWSFEHYGWNKVAAEWEEIFTNILSAKGNDPPSLPKKIIYTKEEIELMQAQVNNPDAKIEMKDKPLRIAVILGKSGGKIHGILDIMKVFEEDGPFMTGTMSGFINIAWGLAERGNQVDAFCPCKEDLVEYPRFGSASFYDLDRNKIDTTYDCYLSVNEPDMLRGTPPEKLRLVAMWLNDFTYCAPGWDQFVDVYATCSETLRNYLEKTTRTPPKKLAVVPLCINQEFYDHAVERKPFSMAYCSSPDRGLHHLLEMFPEIKRRVPETILNIYYRIEPWYESILSDKFLANGLMGIRAKIVKGAFEKYGTKGENGIIVHGPVSTRRIAKDLRQTMVMAYPCDPVRFSEGFSVAVLDACAAGCVPIISGVDAFPEIYGGGAHIISGDPEHKRAEWIDTICMGLTNKEFQDEVRLSAKARAREFTRQKSAAKWEKLIRERMTTK